MAFAARPAKGSVPFAWKRRSWIDVLFARRVCGVTPRRVLKMKSLYQRELAAGLSKYRSTGCTIFWIVWNKMFTSCPKVRLYSSQDFWTGSPVLLWGQEPSCSCEEQEGYPKCWTTHPWGQKEPRKTPKVFNSFHSASLFLFFCSRGKRKRIFCGNWHY